jgi:hypothetical protein
MAQNGRSIFKSLGKPSNKAGDLRPKMLRLSKETLTITLDVGTDANFDALTCQKRLSEEEYIRQHDSGGRRDVVGCFRFFL